MSDYDTWLSTNPAEVEWDAFVEYAEKNLPDLDFDDKAETEREFEKWLGMWDEQEDDSEY